MLRQMLALEAAAVAAETGKQQWGYDRATEG